jgi:hypothetical protein
MHLDRVPSFSMEKTVYSLSIHNVQMLDWCYRVKKGGIHYRSRSAANIYSCWPDRIRQYFIVCISTRQRHENGFCSSHLHTVNLIVDGLISCRDKKE